MVDWGRVTRGRAPGFQSHKRGQGAKNFSKAKRKSQDSRGVGGGMKERNKSQINTSDAGLHKEGVAAGSEWRVRGRKRKKPVSGQMLASSHHTITQQQKNQRL